MNANLHLFTDDTHDAFDAVSTEHYSALLAKDANGNVVTVFVSTSAQADQLRHQSEMLWRELRNRELAAKDATSRVGVSR